MTKEEKGKKKGRRLSRKNVINAKEGPMRVQTEAQWTATVTSAGINGELKGSCTASYIPFVRSWNTGWKEWAYDIKSEWGYRNPEPKSTAREVKPAGPEESSPWGERYRDDEASCVTIGTAGDAPCPSRVPRPLPQPQWESEQHRFSRGTTERVHAHFYNGEWRVMRWWKDNFSHLHILPYVLSDK